MKADRQKNDTSFAPEEMARSACAVLLLLLAVLATTACGHVVKEAESDFNAKPNGQTQTASLDLVGDKSH
jgi:hypothetical protein